MDILASQITVGILMPLGSQVGGAEALLGHLLRHKSPRYLYVCAFLEDGPVVEETRALGYQTTVFHATRLTDASNYLRTIWALRSWLHENRVTLAVSWMSKGHLYLGVAAASLGIKAVWFQHSVPSGSAIMDRLITLIPAEAVLCCSQASQNCQDRLFPERKTYVCYPGVLMPEGNSLNQKEAREYLALPEKQPVVGMVSRLERYKGVHIFIEAAQEILESRFKPTLFVVGGPHSRDLSFAKELRDRATQLNQDGRLIMAGQKSMQEALLWQSAADIIVHPVTGVEPFGMAIVEAMAQGKTVVSSTVGGPSEIIQNGLNGVLIRSGDPKLLASTIISLLERPEERKALEKEAYVRGRSFSIGTFVKRFETLVETVLALG